MKDLKYTAYFLMCIYAALEDSSALSQKSSGKVVRCY